MNDFVLKSSLDFVFEMCTSMTGVLIPLTASEIPTDVCVYAAAFSIMPSKLKPTSWILLINSPSTFD